MSGASSVVSFVSEKLGYDFKDPSLIQRSVTHVSGAVGQKDYETFEFLGDRVLSLVISHWLLTNFPGSCEGDMARRHTALVRKKALVEVAQQIARSQA